jgi:hypothetical protein
VSEARAFLRDPARRAEIVARRPLLYEDGPDPSLERPPHVRAASGLIGWGDRLALIQDDALFFAFADPASGRCASAALPAVSGARTFDPERGNKRVKPDLESLVRIGDRLVGLPSGSAPGRDRLALYPDLRWFDAGALYAALAALPQFSGGELNVEGARVQGDTLFLFNRGNGAAPAVDASAAVPLAAFAAWLDGGPAPEPRFVAAYALGAVAGVRLTLTDVTGAGPALFSAAAEDCPNAVDDGRVVGIAIGSLEDGGWAAVTEDGRATDAKIEGLAWLGERLFAVTDPDDPSRPGELLEIALRGRWPSG